MVLILFLSGFSIGKEQKSTKIETIAQIAEPILIVENNPMIEVNGKKQKEYYEFKVKNYKENEEINQIELLYNIEILTQLEKAITFKLYKNNEEIKLINYKTENMKLKKEEKQEDNYKLEIIYNKEKNISVEDIKQEIQIKVHSEQIRL